MLTKGAVEDLIVEHLSRKAGGGAPRAPRKVPELKRKVFLSDWELRRLRRPGERTLRVPANALISPLSQDWIDFEGITLLRE
jgi:hypothetical protein